jgi:hypothetical protein
MPFTKENRRIYDQKHNRSRFLRRRYRLTPAQYEIMLTAQNGLCAICKQRNPDGTPLAVDHCHQTGKNRGLLCRLCNAAIGMLKDSPAVLYRAIEYLNSHADSHR